MLALGLSSNDTASVWYTLVGLKLLQQNFEANKATWKLVANKARNALKDKLGFSGDIDEALSHLVV